MGKIPLLKYPYRMNGKRREKFKLSEVFGDSTKYFQVNLTS